MTMGLEAMKQIERILIATLSAGIWAMVALQVFSINQTSAQEAPVIDQVQENREAQKEIAVIHASEIVGLSALIQQSVRDYQFRPQSMPGLDLYVKSIVRNCRISGSVSDGRLSSTNISC
jgi:hypothetical protein